MDKNRVLELVSLGEQIEVLYVEDNESVRDATGEILKKFFKNIHIGVDGEVGLKLFKENSINLVITDINMPKMDGITMAEKIKEIDQNVSFIIISAHNEVGFIKKSEEIGIYTYLYKPIDLLILVDTLLETIQEMNQVLEYESS
jgi:YesN/AraC family two-component response regulator